MQAQTLISLIAALAATLVGCGQQSSSSVPAHVIGADNRQSIDASQYPWSAVGRLAIKSRNGSTGACTGTLVATDVVLTAAHCIIDSAGRGPTSVEFTPAYSYGTGGSTAKMLRYKVGSIAPTAAWKNDWALLKLDRDLGTAQGWMGMWGVAADVLTYPNTVSLAGYSGDAAAGEILSLHSNCQLQSRFGTGTGSREGTIKHDCDLTPGASGGPLVTFDAEGLPYIVATQSWHSTTGTKTNGAVATDKALSTFGSL